MGVLLGDLVRTAQPSVQWHLSQMLGEVSLSADERARAVLAELG